MHCQRRRRMTSLQKHWRNPGFRPDADVSESREHYTGGMVKRSTLSGRQKAAKQRTPLLLMRRGILLFLLLLPLQVGTISVLAQPSSPRSPAEPAQFATGAEFTRRLNRPLLASSDYAPLREAVMRLSEDRRIAVAIDRRIDPSRLIRTDLQSPFFDVGISQLVHPAGADAVIAGDTVFVTTPDLASTFRTRVALSQRELESLPDRNVSRLLELTRKSATRWEALASPRSILSQLADRYEVNVEHIDAIPHDLWDSGTIAHADFVTAALWITAQYGFDLKWINHSQIVLVPTHPAPEIEQEHIFRGRTLEQVQELILQQFPDLQLSWGRDRVRFSGRVEQHEAVAEMLGLRAPRKPSSPVVATSLANRRFTLRMNNRPLMELIDLLEKQGIQFDRHPELLEKAGINLNQAITLELQDATIDTLLTQALSPVGLTYEIDGTRISLLPAPPK
jgi:hypothetical protein